MKHFIIFFCIIIAVFFIGCDSSTTNKKPDKANKEHAHEHGPHGGDLLEVGDHVAHIEFIHNEEMGKVTLYILGKDGKTPLAIEGTPMLNLKYKDAQKQLKTVAMNTTENKSSHFEVTDNVLKEEVDGRIAITINNTKYNIDIEHHH